MEAIDTAEAATATPRGNPGEAPPLPAPLQLGPDARPPNDS